jgi:AraC family transcriptional regulator of adaptative response/methylated-DNA-[protein]-cysteine methyltransferase
MMQSTTTLGITPTPFHQQGVSISRFTVAQCSLGALLIAATHKGICEISLGDDPETRIQRLQDRLEQVEQARLEGQNEAFQRWVTQIVNFVENPRLDLSLPLDMRGTAFQQRVWQTLQGIPVGSTVSYADIARRIGAPTAARAVARACATNTIALAIPCHRVVRTDGLPGGYRWGIARKLELLKREGQAS